MRNSRENARSLTINPNVEMGDHDHQDSQAAQRLELLILVFVLSHRFISRFSLGVLEFLRPIEVLEPHRVLLEVGAFADDQPPNSKLAQGPDPVLGPEIGVGQVDVADLALVVEVRA